MIRVYLLIPLLFFLLSFKANAQDWIGLHTSNYAGVQGITFQPASIADSRFRFQMNLIGVSAYVSNNYYSISNDDFQKFNIDREQLLINREVNNKGVFVSTDVMAPFSFMLTMSPKHALALTVRQRNVVNIDNITPDLAELIDEVESTGTFTIDPNESFDASNLYAEGHSWVEYNLTYARVFLDGQSKFLKAGATFKLLNGIASGYAFFNDVHFRGLQNNNVNVLDINTESGLSDNLSLTGESELTYEFLGNPGFGVDLGAVYEFRPHKEKYKQTMDGEEFYRRDKNKYKFRAGLAVLDFGGINYNKTSELGNFSGSYQDLDVNGLNGDIDQILDSLFTFTPGGTYRMSLPTRLIGDIDYNVGGGFFLNLTTQLGLNGGSNDTEKSRYMSAITLTPRIESKRFGLALPISYDKLGNMNTGFSLRLGPLVVGSRDALSNFLFGKDVNSVDVHFGIRFDLAFNKKKDKDLDGVSNKRDECKEIAGVWEFKGCPDSDSDGIEDKMDACPNIPGMKEFNGCPDTDGDGIQDKNDQCIDVPGLPEFNGCPDTDGDGIEDKLDKCIDVAGLSEFNGCPDTDSDGIEDKLDNCPETFGPPEHKGCPDTDGDGLYDYEDKCPEKEGPIENKGCPYEDTDGDGIVDRSDSCPELQGPPENNGCPYTDTDSDGIIDKEDKCPLTPGVPENDGCPKIEEKEQEVLNTAFDNLEFQTGSAIIATSSYTSLVELSNLLKKRPEWKLQIEGHTDNTGNFQTNMRLSKARAQAVAEFLSAQGIDEDRFIVEGYGPTQPIADNTTKIGRQKNRRVEMTVFFE